MSRHCDAIGCTADVSPGLFMCHHHWYMVPAGERATINARYKAGRRNWAFLSDIAYLQAAVDGIDAIAKAEGKTGETNYHRMLRAEQRKANGPSSKGPST